MTKRSTPVIDDTDDYRTSHLERGGRYDSVLAANPFDAYMTQLEKDYLAEVVPTLFPSARPRCLDFACGTGRITEKLVALGGDIVGVDVSPTMLDEARKKCPSVRFVQADLTKTDVDLGTFDLISSFRFFGNAQDELRVAVLGRLHQLLRPGGYLIVNSHCNPHSIAAILKRLSGLEHGFDLHYFKLKRLMREQGFEIMSKRPIGVWMFRSRLMNADPASTRTKRLERAFGHPALSAIAPDTVLVARKTHPA
jgi:ubiquinone/menaquinone biosynthesis C-methylase UbiE